MLLDDLMPRYDVVERHRTVVRAPPSAVFAALREADLAGGVVARTLLAVRAVPAAAVAAVESPRLAAAEWRERRMQRALRLVDFERAGFRVVGERPPEELVLGLLGRFWTPRGGIEAGVSADTFRTPPPAGQALAGWNFSLRPQSADRTELCTETRVWCAPDARLRFRLYWLVVRPGSGLVRRSMLRAIRRRAEQEPGARAGPDDGRAA